MKKIILISKQVGMDEVTFTKGFTNDLYFYPKWAPLINGNEIKLFRKLIKISKFRNIDLHSVNWSELNIKTFNTIVPLVIAENPKIFQRIGEVCATAGKWNLVLAMSRFKQTTKSGPR
jgi:hypothetical protein